MSGTKLAIQLYLKICHLLIVLENLSKPAYNVNRNVAPTQHVVWCANYLQQHHNRAYTFAMIKSVKEFCNCYIWNIFAINLP